MKKMSFLVLIAFAVSSIGSCGGPPDRLMGPFLFLKWGRAGTPSRTGSPA